jgi:hypothetical protein
MTRWYERMRDEQPDFYARLFPRGQVDEQAWETYIDEQERLYGIPKKCTDIPTLLRVARVVASAKVSADDAR